MNNRPLDVCSFCGRDEQERGPFAMGPDAYICESCAKLALQLIEHAKEQQRLPKPQVPLVLAAFVASFVLIVLHVGGG